MLSRHHSAEDSTLMSTGITVEMITFKRPIKDKFILKIGASIKIKKNLQGHKRYDELYFSPLMKKYCGKVAHIAAINAHGFYILDIADGWVWSKGMLEPVK